MRLLSFVMICKYSTQSIDEGALLSRLLHGLKTKQTRFALALKIALLGGAVAFSSVAIADDILKEGITPASDASQIPAAAKLRKDTVVAASPSRRVYLTPTSSSTAGMRTSPTSSSRA